MLLHLLHRLLPLGSQELAFAAFEYPFRRHHSLEGLAQCFSVLMLLSRIMNGEMQTCTVPVPLKAASNVGAQRRAR